MKKFFKVTGVVLGSLAALVFLAWLIVPALPAKLSIKNIYKDDMELLNVTTAPFAHGDIETPDDFVEVERDGVSLKISPDMKKKYSDNSENTLLAGRFFVDEKKENSVVFMNTDNENYVVDDPKIWKGVYGKAVENNYEFWDMIYSVSYDDISIFKHNSSLQSMAWADIKSGVSFGDDLTIYKIDTENAVGFVHMNGHRPENEKKSERYCYELMLFNKNDLNDMHSVLIMSGNQEIVWQIVNSANLCT